MEFNRFLSKDIQEGTHVSSLLSWKTVRAEIIDFKTGKIIFEQDNVEVPEQWSEQAANILAQKYFRKAGVPERTTHVLEVEAHGVPEWLQRSIPEAGSSTTGETSAKQVFHRLAGCWTYWGWISGYFNSEEDAKIFYNETFLALALQMAAPNSPQWFNTGLHWAYGIVGPKVTKYYVESSLNKVKKSNNTYTRPTPHACYLLGLIDDLINPGGIMDVVRIEAAIFKDGAGSGINYSNIRAKGEGLSSGGLSSGMPSFLRISDSAAGAIASGGTTRRAAKMNMIDDDHPEVLEFVTLKGREEHKAASLYVGSEIIKMYSEGNLSEGLSELIPQAIKDRLREGFEAEVYGIGYEGEAIRTVDGQNANFSIRVTDAFMEAVEKDQNWDLYSRTDRNKVIGRIRARDFYDKICRSAWACADPGVIYHDTVNSSNTCPNDGVIRTANPCSEYNFLDWTACNLASTRLTAFLKEDGSFDLPLFEHINRLFTVVLDISVTMASFPTEEFALGAYNYRTLGLGYSDLGGLLMRLGLPYDSTEGRALAAVLTAAMTGIAYKTSAEMAEELGAFPRFEANQVPFMRVMRNHRNALHPDCAEEFEGLNIKPYIAVKYLPPEYSKILVFARHVWYEVCSAKSFRNAQTTLIAPTGTISFAMDCSTTGVEPEFALVKYKNLAGGGTMRIVNSSIRPALEKLGYLLSSIELICSEIERTGKVLTLDEKHNKVFDCANDLRPEAHILMLAAIQPFLSGAASKTINLPNSATVEDVSNVYKQCYKYGIKAVALYRDGSKLAQPLQHEAPSKIESISKSEAISKIIEIRNENVYFVSKGEDLTHLERGDRERLPWRRSGGYTQKTKIGDQGMEQTLFWRTGEYEDGRLGELFITLSKQGSTLRATADALAIAISIGLQHGVPLEKYTEQFMGVKFEPAGYVEGHEDISFASSYLDLIARDLAITYLGRDDLRRNIPAQSIGESGDIGPEAIVALNKAAVAIAKGARPTGETCRSCGGELVQTGRCKQCTNCGWNEGCSA